MPSLFADSSHEWPSIIVAACHVVIALGTAILTGLGWRRRNGWHPPADRRKRTKPRAAARKPKQK